MLNARSLRLLLCLVVIFTATSACFVIPKEERAPRGTVDARAAEEEGADFVNAAARALGLLDQVMLTLNQAAGVDMPGPETPFAVLRDLLVEFGAGEVQGGVAPGGPVNVQFASRGAKKLAGGAVRIEILALGRLLDSKGSSPSPGKGRTKGTSASVEMSGLTLRRIDSSSGEMREFDILPGGAQGAESFAPITRNFDMDQIAAFLTDLSRYQPDIGLSKLSGQLKLIYTQDATEIAAVDLRIEGPNYTLVLDSLHVVSDRSERRLKSVHVRGHVETDKVQGELDADIGENEDPIEALAKAFKARTTTQIPGETP